MSAFFQVDSAEKLAKLLGNAPAISVNDNDRPTGRPVAATTADFECVLVEQPVGVPTESDDEVVEFCKMTCDMSPPPVVDLAV